MGKREREQVNKKQPAGALTYNTQDVELPGNYRAPYPQPFVAPMPQSFYPAPPPLSDKHRGTTASVMVTGDAAVAEVSYQVPPNPAEVKAFQEDAQAQYYGVYPVPKVFTGKGASKRERGDSHDPVTGELLAAARAFDELAARLYREARGRVRAQDNERKQRETRRTKEEWEAMQARPLLGHVTAFADATGSMGERPAPETEIDATVVVRDALKDVAEGLSAVIDALG